MIPTSAYVIVYHYVVTKVGVPVLGPAEVASVLGVALLLGWIARRVWLPGRRWEPTAWAERTGVTLTPRNEALVRAYLVRTRDLRLVGAVGGFLAPHLYAAARGEQLPIPFDFDLFDALIGYLLGAVGAEITLTRPRSPVPSASLAPRELSDYLPRWLTNALRASAGASLAVVMLYRALPEPLVGVDPSMPPTLVIATAVMAVLVGVEAAQRHIVRRPQPAADADILEADDAIRSASVRALAGAGIALELIILSVHLVEIGTASTIQLLRWSLPWLGAGCFVLAISSWVHITQPTRSTATARTHVVHP